MINRTLYLTAKILGPMLRADCNYRCFTYHQFDTGSKYSISLSQFKEQINYLIDEGYNFKKIEDISTYGAYKDVYITIDDGHLSCLKAVEFMVNKGIPFTLFLIAENYISRKRKFNSINIDDINNIPTKWLEIGCHSYSHPILKFSNDLSKEIYEAKNILEQEFKIEILSYAIPYGTAQTFNKCVLNLIEDSGIKYCCTQIPGKIRKYNNIQIIPRIGINTNDNFKNFRLKLNGYYDFIRYI